MSSTSEKLSQSRAERLVRKNHLPGRLLIISNRLPYRVIPEGSGFALEPTVGGLSSALDSVLREVGGTWIGWSGAEDFLPAQKVSDSRKADRGIEYWLHPVRLEREEVENYYLGYSNRLLWPLFHYFQEYCEVESDQWRSYQEVNQKFAAAAVEEYRDGDLIWVHDYHLLLVPRMIRQQIPDARIAFFLHIPFPAKEIYLIAPQAEELVDGLLGADLVGFHVQGYARNFLQAAAELTDFRYSTEPMTIRVAGREVAVDSFPISIDFEQFNEIAKREETEARRQSIRSYYRADFVALGVDRLDYTKGILERLQAIEIMLDRHPELQGRFTFVQISAPSRTEVDTYQEMRDEVERMVGRINGRFGARGCLPIDYRYESHSQEELVAYYRAADVAVVTPLRDGMNLVAKEYVASRPDGDGCLVLSRFTGSVAELSSAVIVSPYQPESTAESIFTALTMPDEERRRRMQKMRATVRRFDIHWWLESFLRRAL